MLFLTNEFNWRLDMIHEWEDTGELNRISVAIVNPHLWALQGLLVMLEYMASFCTQNTKSCFFLLEIANHSNETVLVIGYHLPKVGNNRGSEKFNFLSLSF